MTRYSGITGSGEEVSKAEMIQIKRALKHRWPIPDEVRERLGEQLGVLASRSDSERNRIAAAKVLADLDRLNLDAQKADLESLVDQLEKAIGDSSSATGGPIPGA